MNNRRWSEVIFAALIIIFIIVVIFVLYKIYNIKKKKDYQEALDRSGGGWDPAAREAMNLLMTMPPQDRGADENFAIATGIHHNLLEGDIAANPAAAITAIDRFRTAIGDVRRGRVGEVPAAFILMRAENIGHEILDDINNYNLENVDEIDIIPFHGRGEGGYGRRFRENLLPNFLNFIMPQIGGLLEETDNVRRRDAAERRRAANVTAGGVPAAAAQIYLEKSKTHTSDGQNVHDSAVSKAMKDTFNKLKESQSSALSDPIILQNEINEFIAAKKGEIDGTKLAAAKSSLVDIINNPSMNFSLGGSDRDVLKLVWERSKNKINEVGSDNIKEAIVHALADMKGPDGSGGVCVTGRTGRLLESLTLLDADKSMSSSATVEMYRNEIFDKAKGIIDGAIKSQGNNDVAKYYRGEITTEPPGAKDFQAELSKNIGVMVNEYADKLPENNIEKIKEECMAAL